MTSHKSKLTFSGIWVASLALISLCGCQTWSGLGIPLQNAARVPPPGTGTYPVPAGYYNNQTSGLAPSGQVMQASYNSNEFGNSAGQDASFQPAKVQSASFTNEFPSQPGNQSQVTTATFTDSGAQDVPNLQWQP